MDTWLTRMYERWGERYVPRVLGLVGVVGMLLVPPAATSVPAHYEGLSLGQYAVATSIVLVVSLVGVLATVVSLGPQLRALREWIATREGSKTREAASLAAFQIPRKAAFRLGLYMLLVLNPVGVVVTIAPRDHLNLSEAALIGFGGIFGGIFGMLFWYATAELAMRPIRSSLRLYERPGAPPVNLAARLLLGLLTFPMIVGIGVAGNVIERETDSLFTVYVFSLAATLAGVIVLVPLLSSSVLDPVRDLIRGTRAVGSGDLTARVPITTDDELGELAASFNEMATELSNRSDELRASRARIVAASDEARRKVERDLHDGAQQHLVLLDLKLGLVKAALERDPARAGQIADEATTDLQRALAELRDLAHGIYPSVLSNEGLPAALEQAADRAAIPVSVDCDSTGRYRPELEAAVYFCCLEALQNAAKYAGEGARAKITLRAGDGRLGFEVGDDGRGFDSAETGASAGLQNMADRIGALGGELRVESRPGEGTRVSGAVPVAR